MCSVALGCVVPVTRIVAYRKLGYTEMTNTFTVLSLIVRLTMVTCRNINVHKYFCSFWLLIVSFVYAHEWKLFLVPMRITVSNKRDLVLYLLWTNFLPLRKHFFFQAYVVLFGLYRYSRAIFLFNSFRFKESNSHIPSYV